MSKTYKFGAVIKIYWIFKLLFILLLSLGALAMNTISFSRYYNQSLHGYRSEYKRTQHKKARNYWKRLFRKEKIEQ